MHFIPECSGTVQRLIAVMPTAQSHQCQHPTFSLLLPAGDWFNRIDWTGQHNNFGVGLPPASKNQHSWPFKRSLLAAADRYRPTPDIIARQAAYFKALLRVR